MNAIQVCDKVVGLDYAERKQGEWEAAYRAFCESYDLFAVAGAGIPLEDSWLAKTAWDIVYNMIREAEKRFGEAGNLKIDDQDIRIRFIPDNWHNAKRAIADKNVPKEVTTEKWFFSDAVMYTGSSSRHPSEYVREGWSVVKVWEWLAETYGGNRGLVAGLEDCAEHLFKVLTKNHQWKHLSFRDWERRELGDDFCNGSVISRYQSQWIERKAWIEVKSNCYVDDFNKKWNNTPKFSYSMVRSLESLIDSVVPILNHLDYLVPDSEKTAAKAFISRFKDEVITSDAKWQGKWFSLTVTQTSLTWKFDKDAGKALRDFIPEWSKGFRDLVQREKSGDRSNF